MIEQIIHSRWLLSLSLLFSEVSAWCDDGSTSKGFVDWCEPKRVKKGPVVERQLNRTADSAWDGSKSIKINLYSLRWTNIPYPTVVVVIIWKSPITLLCAGKSEQRKLLVDPDDRASKSCLIAFSNRRWYTYNNSRCRRRPCWRLRFSQFHQMPTRIVLMWRCLACIKPRNSFAKMCAFNRQQPPEQQSHLNIEWERMEIARFSPCDTLRLAYPIKTITQQLNCST